ncbi:MAG: imidazolonepropionase [Candidatus Cloacimonadota bacterium]|nr:MAG: imidazolonepropionase [Candidatus Cloacimonadota bacterium]
MKAIINLDQLVTCIHTTSKAKRGPEMNDVGVISNGAIIIDDGFIRGVGSTYSLQKTIDKIPKENIIDGRGKIVIPGFVDSHTHAIFAGTREKEFAMRLQGKPYMEILLAGGGILNSRKTLMESSDKEIIEQTRARFDRMIAFGTTSVEVKSGYGLSTEQEIRSLELLKVLSESHVIDVQKTFLGAHAVPPEYKDSKSDYVSLVCNEMIPIIASKKLAKYCDVFCEKGVFNVNDTERIFETAIANGLELRLHSDEIESLGGTELACALGARSVDHLIAITNNGLKALEKCETIANLLPGTSYSLMKSYAPAREMINRGIALSLSTDCNPGSCYTESMPMIISLACLNMKLTPAEALNAATFNGACSLGIQDRVGSLEMGKEADLLLLDMQSYEAIPYHFGINPVLKTMKYGKWID